MSVVRIPRDQLVGSDLIVDAIYEGGRAGNAGDDPLPVMLGVSNQGGFRHLGKREAPRLLVVTTSMNEADWPDHLDPETGVFTYYGDNRHPGRDLHATNRWGNLMLRDLFARAHEEALRHEVPPILIFQRAGRYRDSRFLGLAVPGAIGVPPTQDLVAIWRHSEGERFQNYRAMFTVLDAASVSRQWIAAIRDGQSSAGLAPKPWREWIEGGEPASLRAVPTAVFRTKKEQLPSKSDELEMLELIRKHFESTPTAFEKCACRIVEMLLPSVIATDVTRPSRDGGRDAIGKYRIGFGITSIEVDFAVEAKCYGADNPVGVKATSRLISRLRHRQFGVLVTTSYLHAQAYQEIREDSHPILVVCGGDIVGIMKRAGVRDPQALQKWLSSNFPLGG